MKNIIKKTEHSYLEKQKIEEEFSDLAIRFFHGEEFLPLMPYIYSDDPTGNYPIKGSEAWNNLINNQEDYYIYNGEVSLIEKHADDFVQVIKSIGTRRPNILDLGPGSGLKKTLPILESFSDFYKNIGSYIPVDLSKTFLEETEFLAKQAFPKIIINGVQSDLYSCGAHIKDYRDIVAVSFGLTLGNVPECHGSEPWTNTISKLKDLRTLLGKNGTLIIGYDANQDKKSLMKAYNNKELHEHVLYLLHRVKWDTISHGVNPEVYDCHVEWVPEDHRVSYYAVPRESQLVTINGNTIYVPKGKKLHIGNSYKYPVELFEKMVLKAGFVPTTYFQDESKSMTIHILQS